MAHVHWSDLPIDILNIILKKLKDPCDVYRCGLVCVLWKYVVTTILPPFLLLSNVGTLIRKRSQTNETHEIFLPEVDTCLISSSSFGWLLTIRFNQPDEVHLLNPFTRDRIQLPSVREFIHSLKDGLAFCRPDDKYWKYFQDFGGSLEDAVLYKGEFYAVNYLGHIFHLDCNIPAARKVLGQLPIEFLQCEHHIFLVELDGNLLLVVRYALSRFEVYEFNWVEKVWIKE
ncbi:hypothetical protein EZV62_000520 [Acer yangbiense]|uniref:Uncharacterized protein n=1 Tax=Acer yangbiense TaxID=1000413 RepID=A0A5C7IRP8_9ROSI|nr:hypothetical protein EZV62_000520 [Acer yangbiense]